jgi:SagB-type dehydrogenase family enzyme
LAIGIYLGFVFCDLGFECFCKGKSRNMHSQDNPGTIHLPEPKLDGTVSVEYALQHRRSVRRFKNEPLTLQEVSQLLWAAQGITTSRGYRTAPSAGALFPLEIYVISGNVTDLPAGIFKYDCRKKELTQSIGGEQRTGISQAALNQTSVARAPAVLLFCAVYERVTRTYGQRGIPYTFMEVGHAAQNVCLQAVAMRMGTVVIGAFRDDDVKRIANLARDERPVYIIPVGKI